MGIFDVNNKFFQGLNKIIDSIVLNALWLLCCVPAMITFVAAWQSRVLLFWGICWLTFVLVGPATTALYYAVNKVIRHSRSYIWKEYWYAFRSNFKQAAAASLLLAGLGLFMLLDSYIMYQFGQTGEMNGSLYIIFVIFLILIAVWAIYVFSYMARFENTTKQILKNAALIAIASLPWTILLILLLLAAAFILWMSPALFIVVPVVYMIMANVVLERIFKKYMSEEDIAAEQERNQEFYN